MISDDMVSGTVSVADVPSSRLGRRKYGTGAIPVLLLHEWLAAHDNYMPMLSYIDDRRFTYVPADLRGYGLSRHLSGDYSSAEAAYDLLRLADMLGFGNFCLVGHPSRSRGKLATT